MRLLVAEDEKDLNSVITKTLRKNHYTVDACFDGEEALSYLALAEYDAVILDIMMPKVSGLEVLKQLRGQGKRVPVLLLTARSGVSDRVSGLDAGADDYLVKPFAFDELLARIRVILRREADVPIIATGLPTSPLTVMPGLFSESIFLLRFPPGNFPFWNIWHVIRVLF